MAKLESLVLGDDAIFSTRFDLAPEGGRAPGLCRLRTCASLRSNYDDFAGLDVKGKVDRLHRGIARRSSLRAVGALSVRRRASAHCFANWEQSGSSPFRTRRRWTSPGAAWRFRARIRVWCWPIPPSMTRSGIDLAVTFNPADAEKLFAGSGHTFVELAPIRKNASLSALPVCPYQFRPAPGSSRKMSSLTTSSPSSPAAIRS